MGEYTKYFRRNRVAVYLSLCRLGGWSSQPKNLATWVPHLDVARPSSNGQNGPCCAADMWPRESSLLPTGCGSVR
jgi:hypothetical protein